MNVFVIIILYSVAFGAYTAQVADEKGYSGTAWFFGGLFFNFIALIAVAGLPMKKDPLS